ncbi:SnoaL-like protein [Novosphingobium kunmingense]|uniref:SnoaL-like protein n=2 Tax=Novosphingobium kunmingense TaxID=1211806 RepID=A0A2N0H5E7_9SPHN|nr:SnoaL-like protein [Novosphingobium kunmingense]
MLLTLSVLALAAQPLPRVEALPPPAFEDAEVLAAAQAIFAPLETGDGPALLKLVYPDGRVTASGTLPSGFSGTRSRSWADYAARMKLGAGFVERISNPVVEVDGDVAMVWAPFTITEGGKVLSCGIDHFDMVRESGVWKVMNITFSSRVTGCPGQ